VVKRALSNEVAETKRAQRKRVKLKTRKRYSNTGKIDMFRLLSK
jgi:hypothetical protein